MVDMQLMGATMEDIETMDEAIETMEEAMEDIELTDGHKRHHVRAGAKANKRKRQGGRRKHHGRKRRGNKSGKATPMPTSEPTKYYPTSKLLTVLHHLNNGSCVCMN